MELLYGPLLALLTQFFKWCVGKFGKENTTIGTYLFVFIVAIGVNLYQKGFALDWSNAQSVVEIVSLSIATYEVIIKRVIFPALGMK